MKIAFIHYHLKTGGVTTCLKQQLEALKNDCDTCVVTGELAPASFPAKTIHIPELAYSSVYRKPFEAENVAASVARRIRSEFDGPCDIVHVHNPLLAKNAKFLEILKGLQKEGFNLLLQVHDFAEDGRAALYFSQDYPANCHYCVVNSRDYQILLKSGLKKKGLHQLPNCVSLPQSPPKPVAQEPWVVYPIRAIRRKNIGEAILLSLFFKDPLNLVITLPPNSAPDMASYSGWKAFVAEHHLSVEFDRGLNDPFESIVRSARYLLTTSITEGFGFSFLEPWLYGKIVWGRKLSDICIDFESCGVNLDHMYTQLMVSIEGFDSKGFYNQWKRTIVNSARILDVQIDAEDIRSAYDAITESGIVDFGLLAEAYQKQVLRHLLSKKAHTQKLLSLNPLLSKIGSVRPQRALVESNYHAAVRNYGISQYRKNLLNLYEQMLETAIQQKIDKKKLSAKFFDLRRFSLLKWGDDDRQ